MHLFLLTSPDDRFDLQADGLSLWLVERRYRTRDEQGSTKNWRRDPGSRLTALGSNLAYHCAEFSLQSAGGCAGDSLERFLRLSALGAGATVLDVGCGAGQTLRLLGRALRDLGRGKRASGSGRARGLGPLARVAR